MKYCVAHDILKEDITENCVCVCRPCNV